MTDSSINPHTSSGPSIAIVILAAGSASRFGSPKQLASLEGSTLLERSVALCHKLSFPLYVILGAHSEQILKTANLSQASVMINSDWQEGIASSIRVAVEHIGKQHSALLFLAADQVAVSTAELTSLISLWAQAPDTIAAAHYLNNPGIPAIFPKAYFSELRQLTGDRGAKALLQQYPVRTLPLPSAAIDIDTIEDLQAFDD